MQLGDKLPAIQVDSLSSKAKEFYAVCDNWCAVGQTNAEWTRDRGDKPLVARTRKPVRYTLARCVLSGLDVVTDLGYATNGQRE